MKNRAAARFHFNPVFLVSNWRMNKIIGYFLGMVLFIGMHDVQAQPWNTARLSVIEGGTVEFNFNSFDEYENGITSTNGTVLGITIANLAAGSALASWTLDFETDLGATSLQGQGTNTLDLDVIELTASENFGFAGETVTFSGPLALMAASQTLVSTSDTDLPQYRLDHPPSQHYV